MQYDRVSSSVVNLFIIPGHFMSIDAVKKRKPLSDSARRLGWTGSTILLNKLAPDARINIVQQGNIRPIKQVRREWNQFDFMKERSWKEKGWLNDVLNCIRDLEKKDFTLKEMYSFENRLSNLHPRNHHIKPKIRQQLQVLRDNGILEFVERGRYHLIA